MTITANTGSTPTVAALCQQYQSAEVEAFAADDAAELATREASGAAVLDIAKKAANDHRLDKLGKAVIEAPCTSIADVLAKAEIAAANLNVENDDPGFGDLVMRSLIADLRRMAGAS